MGTRRGVPRKARQEAPVAAGPLRNGHKAALKKIWDKRPCLPSVASRKAWASARGLDPTFVNRWFYAQLQKARTFGFELDTENEGYDLEVEDRSPAAELSPITPSERESIPHSTTPEGLPELSCYQYSTYSETGLRIPLSPDQSSSPVFGSSFYSPKLILDSPSSAYSHLPGPEQFLFTPPRSLRHERMTRSRSYGQHFAKEHRTQIRKNISPLPGSTTPNNRLPPLPPAPKKPRPSRGNHDVLNFRTQDDPCFRFSPPTSLATPMPSGYLVPYHGGSWVEEDDDKPNLSTFSDLRMIVAKTSCLTDQKRVSMDDKRTVNDSPNDHTAHLPSQAKHRWLHRVHRRPINKP